MRGDEDVALTLRVHMHRVHLVRASVSAICGRETHLCFVCELRAVSFVLCSRIADSARRWTGPAYGDLIDAGDAPYFIRDRLL